MPDKCCIVGCRVNYTGGPKKSVFYFPQDEELKRKWIRFVNRKDWIPSKHSVICVDHFADEFITIHNKKSLLKLNISAVPSIYPTSTSSSSILPTISPARKPPTIRNQAKDEIQIFMKDDICTSINDFTEKHCPNGFTFSKQADSTVVYFFAAF